MASPALLPGQRLAGRTLPELRAQYRADLFDDFLPFMDAHVIDRDFGGFMCNADRLGRQITTNKDTWYEGRGVWVYSFLYEHFGRDPWHLEVARRALELNLKLVPRSDQIWPRLLSRDGSPLGSAGDIYCALFVVEGLVQYARAAQDSRYLDLVEQILASQLRLYESPAYEYLLYYGPIPNRVVQAPRVLGHWMVLLRLATQFLECVPDPGIAALADRCVDAILRRHLRPDCSLILELVRHDLSLPADWSLRFAYVGHAIEALWMVMTEALRRQDRGMFADAAAAFKRHVEVAWDDVYGGAFACLSDVDQNTWNTDKLLWLQEEVLVGTLLLYERTGDPWAETWFSRMYEYVREHFPLRRHGYPLWQHVADRKVTFVEQGDRIENYHHPRHLMLNLLSLERMIRRAEASAAGAVPFSPAG
jgi:N-acylglucosamine 2-epimerase